MAEQKLLTAEQIASAPSDLVEEVIEIPEFGGKVKLRSFSAAKSAEIKQRSIDVTANGSDVVAWAESEITQLREGIVEPELSEEQCRAIYQKHNRPVRRVIAWLDEKSGIDKEELRKTRKEFRASND